MNAPFKVIQLFFQGKQEWMDTCLKSTKLLPRTREPSQLTLRSGSMSEVDGANADIAAHERIESFEAGCEGETRCTTAFAGDL